MCAWVLNVGVRNPGKHLASLSKHIFSSGIHVGEHLDRNAGLTNQRRDRLHNLFVLLQLLSGTELLTRRNQPPHFRIFGDESWISCLAVYISNKAFYSNSLLRIATVDQNFGFRLWCERAHDVLLKSQTVPITGTHRRE